MNNEIKVSLNVILPGRVMFSKDECLKTIQKTVEKTNKRTGKSYKKIIDILVEDSDKIEVGSLRVTDKNIITYTTRKCRTASQSVNINKDAYKHMVSMYSCPSYIKQFKWNQMNKEQRLRVHLKEMTEHLGGVYFTYQVFED